MATAKRLIGAACITAALFLPLQAESWSFSIDNDMVFGSDDKYTGGFQIGWMSDELGESGNKNFAYRYADGMSDLLQTFLPFDFTGMRRNGAMSLQGVAVTPEDTDSREPVYDDVPYMGSTALSSSLFIWNERVFHEASITLGAVGPASGADKVQKAIHRFFGLDEPNGWDNQVGNRLLLQAGYTAGTRQYSHRFADAYDFEWFNSFSATAGSTYVGAGAGTAVRIGENVPANFVSINGIINRSLANQLNLGERSGTWGWSFNVGLFVDLIGYFYLYEYSKEHGYEWDRPTAVATGRVGFDLYYKTLQVSLELYPSRPIGEYVRSNYYGRLNLVLYVP
jgi:lipid A 3-O-deacylase